MYIQLCLYLFKERCEGLRVFGGDVLDLLHSPIRKKRSQAIPKRLLKKKRRRDTTHKTEERQVTSVSVLSGLSQQRKERRGKTPTYVTSSDFADCYYQSTYVSICPPIYLSLTSLQQSTMCQAPTSLSEIVGFCSSLFT